jgi:hypothetical protein
VDSGTEFKDFNSVFPLFLSWRLLFKNVAKKMNFVSSEIVSVWNSKKYESTIVLKSATKKISLKSSLTPFLYFGFSKCSK